MKYVYLLLLILHLPYSSEAQYTDDPIITKSIYFGGGSYDIDLAQAAELQALIKSLEHPELYEVYVHGHTDNIGSIEYNQWLSDMRTDMVIQKILEVGIGEESIFEKDFGEESPVYDNNTRLGQLKNRRVDIILKKLEM